MQMESLEDGNLKSINEHRATFSKFGIGIDLKLFEKYCNTIYHEATNNSLRSIGGAKPDDLVESLKFVKTLYSNSHLQLPEKLDLEIILPIARYLKIKSLNPKMIELIKFKSPFKLTLELENIFEKNLHYFSEILTKSKCPITVDEIEFFNFSKTFSSEYYKLVKWKFFRYFETIDKKTQEIANELHQNGIKVRVKDLYTLSHPDIDYAFDGNKLVSDISSLLSGNEFTAPQQAFPTTYSGLFNDGNGFSNLELFRIFQVMRSLKDSSSGFYNDLTDLVQKNASMDKLGELIGVLIFDDLGLRLINVENQSSDPSSGDFPLEYFPPNKVGTFHTHFREMDDEFSSRYDASKFAGPSGKPYGVFNGTEDFEATCEQMTDGIVVTPIGLDQKENLGMSVYYFTPLRATDLGNYLISLK